MKTLVTEIASTTHETSHYNIALISSRDREPFEFIGKTIDQLNILRYEENSGCKRGVRVKDR